MESFISELETKSNTGLANYLKSIDFDDYELSDKELKALRDYNVVEWGKYELNEIFDVLTSKKRFDANKTELLSTNGNPYVVRQNSNNGIKGYLKEDSIYLNEGNTISFGQDTATSFYQKDSYFTGDKIKILKSKYKEFNRDNALFFVTVINRSFSKFSWGTSSYNVDIIKNQQISLPIVNRNINFKYIEVLTKAISKSIIQKLVAYNNKHIN